MDIAEQKLNYKSDVVARARSFNSVPLGAYSNSKGHLHLRQMVCDFLQRRDGYKADPEMLFLSDGASVGAKTVLQLMIRTPKDGVLIPIPQYPLYSATLTMLGGIAIPYYTNEDESWGFTADTLQTAITKFHNEHPDGNIRGLVVINPGNPTGGILEREVMEDCLKICAGQYKTPGKKDSVPLVLIADEVYQENLWKKEEKEWHSFRKICNDVGSDVEMFSLHSISKGYYGECGLRGGFLQCENIDDDVMSEIVKLFSLSLCSNTIGQCMIASILNPPKLGDPSYALFYKERGAILDSMKKTC
jgi:aspartate/methionine/tyrosine aminotransferase